jgi:hypothetical protein
MARVIGIETERPPGAFDLTLITIRPLDHRRDEGVMKFCRAYGLYGAIARVPSTQVDGIEAYLAPKHGDTCSQKPARYPAAYPLQ